jgi:hypothetical protein
MVVRYPQLRAGTVRTPPKGVGTMTKAIPEQRREINHRARNHGGPDLEADRGASGADSDRQRRTSDKLEPSRNRELVVILWVLASLIAEIELWSWVFAHMYRP